MTVEEFYQKVLNINMNLSDCGIVHGNRVLIMSSKSLSSISAVFSCLFGNYILILVDNKTPEDRLEFILKDCRPDVILCDESSLKKNYVVFTKGEATKILCLDSFDQDEFPDTFQLDYEKNVIQHKGIPQKIGENYTAYIIYTSGSTGTPKGVTVSRKALYSFLKSSIIRARYSEGIRFLNFFPLHFDPVLMEIIMPWIVGGTTVIFNKFLLVSHLIKALEKYRITDFSCTPNIITLMVANEELLKKYDLQYLRSIWFGGETPNLKDVEKFKSLLPHVDLFNGYGPTETIIACSLHEVTPEDFQRKSIPIGTPMPGVIFRIMKDGEFVEANNVTGELCVTGRQVMQGYWNSLDNDDANRFMTLDGTKFFMTGDIVYKENGLYYFVGRINHMIKIRGYRIFPQEIENSILQHGKVSNTVVMYSREKQKLFSVVEVMGAVTEQEAIQAEITEIISRKLPDYMHPDKIILYNNFPRLSNGKLDIQKLKKEIEI